MRQLNVSSLITLQIPIELQSRMKQLYQENRSQFIRDALEEKCDRIEKKRLALKQDLEERGQWK